MLKRLACVASAVMVLALAAGADDASPSIKQIMTKLHKGANSPIATVKAQLKAQDTDWKKVQNASKDFVILGAGLAKQDPPKGEKANWTKLADNYFQDSKALDDAAKAENKPECQAALKKLGASCKSCHEAHKGQ